MVERDLGRLFSPLASCEVRDTNNKVFWSEGEKYKIIVEAADIQARRPDLSGLPLLRSAMSVLQPARRRKVIALSQAPWFEPGVTDEINRRATEAKANANIAPLIKATADANATIAGLQKLILRHHESWKAQHAEAFGRIIGLLEEVLAEIRAMREPRGPNVASRPRKR